MCSIITTIVKGGRLLANNYIQIREVNDVLVTTRKIHSERLLIYFGWASAPSVAKMIGVAPLFTHDTSSIAVRDPHRCWYNSAINGLSRDADDLLEQLSDQIGTFPRHMINACGFSMGDTRH